MPRGLSARVSSPLYPLSLRTRQFQLRLVPRRVVATTLCGEFYRVPVCIGHIFQCGGKRSRTPRFGPWRAHSHAHMRSATPHTLASPPPPPPPSPLHPFSTRFHAVSLHAGANSGSNNNLFYSFNQGLTHFIVFDDEAYAHSQSADFLANQLAFMKADLAAVNRSVTPWVVGLVHRDWTMMVRVRGRVASAGASAPPRTPRGKRSSLRTPRVPRRERGCNCHSIHPPPPPTTPPAPAAARGVPLLWAHSRERRRRPDVLRGACAAGVHGGSSASVRAPAPAQWPPGPP